MNVYKPSTVYRAFIVLLGMFVMSMPVCEAAEVMITVADIEMAHQVIGKNTRSLPGFNVGSRVTVSSGRFSSSDALVLYILKFHQQTRVCPPIAVVAGALTKLKDADVHKKAVVIFWKDYSTTSNLNEGLDKPTFLRSSFEWYILTKQTERLKIRNARLQGFVGADTAWRRAMDSQQKFWEKSQSREDEFILRRDAYRAVFDAQAAVGAAERAVAGGF